MQNIDAQAMISTLNTAILGNLCVEAVLGAYNNLYLGFGQEVLPPRTVIRVPGGKFRYVRHAEPPYRLATCYSFWWIRNSSQIIASSEGGEEDAEIAALSLVGKNASSWEFLQPGWGLKINFMSDLELIIQPDPEFTSSAVWSLEDSYGLFWNVKTDAHMFTNRANEIDP